MMKLSKQKVTIDTLRCELNVDLSASELADRRKKWVTKVKPLPRGVLSKYRNSVKSAHYGATTLQ